LISANHKTLDRFIEGVPDDGYSLLALHAKASVLVKKAIENSQTHDQGLPSPQIDKRVVLLRRFV
jgi:hypothetical protein